MNYDLEKKNQLVEMEMTKMMELTEKDFKQTVYSPYSQKCRGKICMTRTEIEDIKNKKKTQIEFLEMKIQHL